MNFEKLSWLPYIGIAGIILLYVVIIGQHRFNVLIKTYWLKRPTFFYLTSFLCYILAIVIFLFSMLDLRGKPEKLSANLPDQKTIIIIDTSLSMSAEDVRPNRLDKGILLAKHFVKKAIGHQISLGAFSDNYKQLVPFTNDIDLIDARLDSLKDNGSSKGGSAIVFALNEAIQYFKNKDGFAPGNILLITDSEDTGDDTTLKIPKEIALGIVAIGTAKGGNIPIRDRYGNYAGVKQFNGQPVESKLDESFLQKLKNKAEIGKYWIVSTYSIPTTDVIDFFNKTYKGRFFTGDVVIKPVYGTYVIACACIFLLLSILLRFFKRFKSLSAILIVFILPNVYANEKEEIKISEKTLKKMEDLKSGKLNMYERLKLAEALAKEKSLKVAESIYKETLQGNKTNGYEKSKMNYATTMLAQGNIKSAISSIQKMDKTAFDDETKQKIRENVLLSLLQQKKKEEQEQKGKQNQKDKQENKQENSEKNDGDKNGQNKDDQSKGKSGQNKSKDSEQIDKKDKSDSEKNNDKEDDKDSDKKENEKNKKEDQQKVAGKPKGVREKLPAFLKQLLDTDKNLQQQLFDTSTDNRANGPKKDW